MQQCKSCEANTASCPITLTVQKGTALWRRQNRMPLHNCCNSCHLSMDKARTALLCLSTSSPLMSSEGRKAPLFPFYRAGKAETMGPAERHKPQAVWQVFSEVPVSSHLTLEAPKYQYFHPNSTLKISSVLQEQSVWRTRLVTSASTSVSGSEAPEDKKQDIGGEKHQQTACMPFLISVIVLTTLLSHRASSCSVSQAQRVLIIPGIAEEFQEKEVTLCLTGLWADCENAPQGSRKVGLESPFCPGDASMMSHCSAPQHQRPSALWPSNDLHCKHLQEQNNSLQVSQILCYLQQASFLLSRDVRACGNRVAARKALLLLEQHLQHAFQDQPNQKNSFC